MKPDISKNDDIKMIVESFYHKAKADKTIGFFFSEITSENWEKHLQKMCSFWENIIFFTGDYEGNPIVTHRQINQKNATTTIHFQRWMKLFDTTVNEHFVGPNAKKMKEHAKAIAAAMLLKL